MKIVEYNWNHPNCDTWKEKFEWLYLYFTEIAAKMDNPILSGPFNLISSWCSSDACYGSDYFRKWEWESQDIWDQGYKTIYKYEDKDFVPKYRLKVFINMRMPEDELWIEDNKDKTIIKLINYER